MSGITCFHYGTGPSNPETTDCPAPSYDPDPGETVMVDPRGVEEIHQFDTSFRPTAVERVVNSVDIDVFYTYETDSETCSPANNGNLCSVTDPLGNVTSYTYDSTGNVLSVTTPVRQAVGAAESGTDCGTNGTGDGTDDDSDTIIDDGCPNTVLTHTSLNDVATATDARGNLTTYTYTDGNLTSIENALTEQTTFDYEDANDPGLVTSITDPLTNATLFTYDEFGNQLTVEDAEGNVTSYTYDDGGRVLSVTEPSRAATSTAESGADCGTSGTGDGEDDDSDDAIDDGCPSTIFEHDNQNNVTKVIEAFISGGPPITEYVYDAVGNRTGVRNANRQASGTAESGTNCDSATGTGNGVDNDSDSVVDDGCLSTAYVYDEKNRLETVFQARIAGEGSTRRTDYTYDANDNLASIKDPVHQVNGNVTEFTYDDANRLTLVERPDVHYYTAFEYDAAGRRQSMTDTRGACEGGYSSSCATNTTKTDETLYDYDDDGRLTLVETNFADVERIVEYAYDYAGNRTSITYPDSKIASYSYDELNRLEEVSPSWYSGDTTYTYDAAGRLDLVTLPSSTDITVDYEYDNANRLVGITNADSSTTISSFDYVLDANGNRTQVTDVNSGVTVYEYDELERLTDVEYPEGDCGQFAYDIVGNRTSLSAVPQVTDPCDGTPATTSYVYDQVDQLKSIDSVNNTSDKNGNLLTIGSGGNNTFLYDYDNKLYRTGPCRGDVNGDGDVSSGDQGALAARLSDLEGSSDFDQIFDLNEDMAISSGDQGIMAADLSKTCYNTGSDTGNARHWYNGGGLRMRQRTFYSSPSRVDNDYVWDQGAGLPVILQDVRTPSTGSATTTTYLYGLGLISQTDAGGESFFLRDGLGSASEVVESDGDVANAYTYDVWGVLRSSSGSVSNQFTYAGEQQDANANRGLMYLRARFYDPSLGRFLSRDPLPLENRYSYGSNNPSNYIDPFGLDECGFSLTGVKDCVGDVGECIANKGDCAKDAAETAGTTLVKGAKRVANCSRTYGVTNCPGLIVADFLATKLACRLNKESYFDVNISLGVLTQGTAGAQFSCSSGLHPYGGLAVGLSPTPVSGAVSVAPGQSISQRLGCGLQGYAGLGGQVGRGGGFTDSISYYGEIGVGTPQVSYSCYNIGPRP